MQKYSVLMSLYREENPEYLRISLNSVICQTLKPDEIVIVEDGELTEELYNVVNEFVKKQSEIIRIIVNEKNLGLGLSLQKGVLACTNELIARMDTDDISVADRCEKQVKFLLENKDIAIVGGQLAEFESDPRKLIGKRLVPLSDKEIKQFMKKRCPFNHVTVMFRKKAILSGGNYREWFCNEDYDLWIRLAGTGIRFANLPDVLVYVRIGNGMYTRRGGIRYFRSEWEIQNLMLQKEMIGILDYLFNVSERFIVQVLLPNCVRGILYRKFARVK